MSIVTIPFPQHVYNVSKLSSCGQFFEKLNIKYFPLPSSHIDYGMPHSEACEICKVARRSSFVNYYTPLRQDNDVIITAHNLSDLMAYYLELTVEALSFQKNEKSQNRMLEMTNKFLPSYTTELGTEITRPLLDFSQQEIHQILSGGVLDNDELKIISNKCIWSNQRKRLLQDYFVKSEVVSSFSVVNELLIKNFSMPTTNDFMQLPYDTYLM